MPDVVASVVELVHALRADGATVGPDRVATAIAALNELDASRRSDVYWALRLTLVTSSDSLAAFDRLFTALVARGAPAALRPDPASAGIAEGTDAEAAGRAAGWTAEEILRRRDFSTLDENERQEVGRLIRQLPILLQRHRTRRLRAGKSVRLDPRRTVREAIRGGGEIVAFRYRRRVDRPRRLVLLCDVSGSMERYARPLLLFAHALLAGGAAVEAFAFGTRLTPLTRELTRHNSDEALQAASARVKDWSGGTRIGAALGELRAGRGVRGATVVILSDGWDRGDCRLLAREMQRLSRSAYRVIWVNPLKGDPDYQPLAVGMRAALPHIDVFLPGHNVAALEMLARALAA